MIYVLSYEDETSIVGVRIFSNFNMALKEYLTHCITETRLLLTDDEEDTDSSLDCVLEIHDNVNGEYITVRQYDCSFFQKLLDSKEDIADYLDQLEESLITHTEVADLDIARLFQ
jgi:hypothetical protein